MITKIQSRPGVQCTLFKTMYTCKPILKWLDFTRRERGGGGAAEEVKGQKPQPHNYVF